MSKRFYRVGLAASLKGYKLCEREPMYTVVSGPKDDPTGIGTSWGCEELAIDVCDLMNMAYDAGQENALEVLKCTP